MSKGRWVYATALEQDEVTDYCDTRTEAEQAARAWVESPLRTFHRTARVVRMRDDGFRYGPPETVQTFESPRADKDWCLHCGSETCQHVAGHNAAYGQAAR